MNGVTIYFNTHCNTIFYDDKIRLNPRVSLSTS